MESKVESKERKERKEMCETERKEMCETESWESEVESWESLESDMENKCKVSEEVSIVNTPPSQQKFRCPDASTFKLRGASYLLDKKKEVSDGKPIFELLAIDLIESEDSQSLVNIASHANNRVSMSKARGENSFIFVFNILIPGPPHLAFVVYWSVDRNSIESDDTPFSRIAKPFFYGDDTFNTFRDQRFKMIPRVVEGNPLVKYTVQDTPTLLGTKLKQTYHRADHYFEIDVDISSNWFAANVVKLSMV